MIHQSSHIFIFFYMKNSSALNASQQEERNRVKLENVITLKKLMCRLIQNRKSLNCPLDVSILDKLIPLTIFGKSSPETLPNEMDMLTEDELLHNCYSIMTAGFETTAHTLVVSLYNLQTFDTEVLQDKKYIKGLVKESLRLFPPVLQMIRYSLEDVYLGDILVSKGTRVYCDIIGTHYSKSYWGNHPEDFDLNRWISNENCTTPELQKSTSSFLETNNKKHWIPFGYGAKSCVGQSLAMMVVESVLETFLEHFDVVGCKILKPFKFTQTPSMRVNSLELLIKRKDPRNQLKTFNVTIC